MQGIYPPIDALPCLSRLMNQGIGKGRTREDHKDVSNQIYALYAEGRDLRDLVAVVGEEALTDREKRVLTFANEFEDKFVRQKPEEDRDIFTTLGLGWHLMSIMDREDLTKIGKDLIEQNYPKEADRWKPDEKGESIAHFKVMDIKETDVTGGGR